MKSPRYLLRVLAVVALSLAPASAVREEHPHLHAASEAIRKAQGSAQPIAELRTALQRLRAARDNKGGYRAAAARRVAEAIAALEAGKRVEADKALKLALSDIEKAVALHPRDRAR